MLFRGIISSFIGGYIVEGKNSGALSGFDFKTRKIFVVANTP